MIRLHSSLLDDAQNTRNFTFSLYHFGDGIKLKKKHVLVTPIVRTFKKRTKPRYKNL